MFNTFACHYTSYDELTAPMLNEFIKSVGGEEPGTGAKQAAYASGERETASRKGG